jgi:hypothetical protein
MKSKKAEMNMIGIILIAFVGIVVGLAMYQSIVQYVGQAQGANQVTAVNTSITGVLNTNVELTGQELVSTQLVTNASGATVAAANYTISECIRSSDSMKGICYKALGAGDPSATGVVKVSYTYQPNGYIDDAGGRGMAGLIAIFAALAIGLIALWPVLQSKILDMMN